MTLQNILPYCNVTHVWIHQNTAAAVVDALFMLKHSCNSALRESKNHIPFQKTKLIRSNLYVFFSQNRPWLPQKKTNYLPIIQISGVFAASSGNPYSLSPMGPKAPKGSLRIVEPSPIIFQICLRWVRETKDILPNGGFMMIYHGRIN